MCCLLIIGCDIPGEVLICTCFKFVIVTGSQPAIADFDMHVIYDDATPKNIIPYRSAVY